MLAPFLIEDIGDKLRNALIESEATLKGWKNVTRNKKKNGGDYQSINKNFNGAKIDPYLTSNIWLNIHAFENGRYYEDSILLGSAEDDISIDAAFQKIRERIAALENDIAHVRDDLDHYNEIVTETCNKIEKTLDELANQAHSTELIDLATELISSKYKYYRLHK